MLLVGSRAATSPQTSGRVLRSRPRGIHEKILALTFDDGPDTTNTPRILDALRAHHAHATFFVLGAQAKRHPKLLRRMVTEGHAIGNHSWSHPARGSASQARHEVDDTARVIRDATARAPQLFRPPYGVMNNGLAALAQSEGYTVVLWTISGADTRPITSRQIADNIVYTPDPGDIALLHDGPGHTRTAEAVPMILDELARAGWKFVTIPELFVHTKAAR
jgi:peptidoglycan/xylan/chitin deacetylase (PgdA/CDA1 family)